MDFSVPEFTAKYPLMSYDFSLTHTNSDLDITRLDVNLHGQYRLSEAAWVEAEFRHATHDDDAPYLWDTTGERTVLTLMYGRQF